MGEPQWPVIEAFLVSWLRQETGVPVYTETPRDLQLPALQIAVVGGSDNRATSAVGGPDLQSKIVDVEVNTLCPDRGSMWDLAGRVQTTMYLLSARGEGSVYVDEVSESFAPAPDPHPNPNVRSTTATYTLVVRPMRSITYTA